MKLEDKLVSLRKERGLTQFQVEEKIDVSRQAISKWEVGVSVSSTDNLKCSGELYGISVDDLLNEDTDSPVQKESFIDREARRPAGRRIKKYCNSFTCRDILRDCAYCSYQK